MPLPTLDYYDEQYRKRKANEPVASITALDREVTRMRSAEIRENLFLSASPDAVARVNRVSRETGELPLLVEDRVSDYEKALTEQKFIQASETINSLGKWAVNNPLFAASAADDWESLSTLGKAWQGVKNVGASWKVGTYRAGVMAQDTFDAVGGINDAVAYPIDAAIATLANQFGFNLDPDQYRKDKRKQIDARKAENERYIQENRPDVDGWLSRNLLAGIESIPLTLTAIATRNPEAGAGLLGGVVAGSEYQTARGKGLTPFDAAIYGASQGAIEALTERIPVSRLIGDIAKKTPIGKTLVNQLVAEIPGEQAATVLQDLNEWAVLNPDKAFGEYLAERLSAAAETFVQTVGGVGATVTMTKAAERTASAAVKLTGKVLGSQQAKVEADLLDKTIKAADASKLKARDVEAFKSLLEALAGDSEVENVYVSGEALKEYMQSESYEPSDALSGWLDRVEEASATGGDVVMPIAEAAITLGPIWQNIKDDVRLSAGGMTRKEANAFDEAMADVMDELATVMAEQDKAESQVKTEREALASSIIGKLQNAGFTPSTARTQAELLVQRYATRMARLGRPLTGKEFDAVTVNQVLPEELQAARKADQLDLVINSYFTMKNPKAATGKSLVEWIAERGGVTDEGGDLEDMGLGKWHREKAFRKRALRKSEKGQSSFVAADDKFSRNSVLRAAVDQGYFPELETETNLDERALLEAIDAELRGVPRYAQERIADDVRELAGQLDEFLSQAGFDPANMTPEQMRDAIESTQDAQLGGEVFEGAAAIEQEWDSIQGGEVVAFEDASGIRIEVKRTGPNTYEVSSFGGFQKFSEEQLKDNAREQNYIATAESKEEARKRNIAFSKRKYQAMQEAKALAEDIGAPDGFVLGYGKALSGEPMPQSYLTEAGAPYREGYERAVADGKAGTLSNTGPAREARQSTGQTYTQATITIDGVERPTQNSNGQPLAQTEEGLRNFWNWFGDSKVVDAEGRPLVVYHGTGADIEAFNGITWASVGTDLANEYAFMREVLGRGAATVLPLYVRAERIFDADAGLSKSETVGSFFNNALEQSIEQGREIDLERARALLDTIRAAGKREESGPRYDRHDFWNKSAEMFGRDGAEAIRDMFDLMGFDGIKMRENGSDTFGAFSPTQIKSINNRGTFDASDPRILFQSGSGLPNSSANQGLAQSLAADAKLLGDVTQSPAFRDKGLGGFDAPSRAGGYEQATIEIDGVERPTRNSNGQPLAQTEEGLRNFYAWFADSKVVDAEGRPLVVYHGTNADVESFDPDQLGSRTDAGSAEQGFFFSDDRRTAESYAQYAATDGEANIAMRKAYKAQDDANRLKAKGMEAGSRLKWREYDEAIRRVEELDRENRDSQLRLRGQVVMPVYLSIQSPAETDARGGTFAELDDSLSEMMASAKDDGADGAIIRNFDDAAGLVDVVSDHFVAFRPEQIKSVNNTGAFDPADARILYQSAFHGSPHIFDKFSLDKIGTGEGAQAYGWGLYFAGRKEIAEHYRKILSEETYVTSDGNVWSPDELQHLNIRVMARRNGTDLALTLKQISERGLSESDMRAHDEAMLKDLMARGGIEKASGRLYQVDIPEDNEYLLWDATLSEQPGDVWDRLIDAVQRNMGDPMGEELAAMFEAGDIEGKDAYNWVVATFEKGEVPDGVFGLQLTNGKAAQMASEIMREAGIAGIKYLDGGSRAAGDGSYNYVVFDDSRVSIKAYEQSYEDNARGKITFNSGQATIDLFKTRNLSTFLHETGHLWLEELAFDASLPEAPQQLKDDWQTVQDWFASQGHKVENGMIPTDAHEMWARGVERYLMEGKSPIGSLKRIFETFKAWLTAIYKTVDALKSPITPEVREVMDRLIATDEQIQDIAEQQKVEAVFKDAAEAGMSDAEFQAYVKQTEDARSEAKGKLIEKVMRSIRSRETKAYRDSAQNVRDEIEPEVDARPLFKALRNLKEQPIDSGWLKEEMGEDAFRLLPRRRPAVYKDGGVHPDVIAEQSGFATGKAMVEALMGAEIAHRKAKEGGDTRSMRERTIQEEVSAIMQARYGDPLNDGSIEREALEVVHNDMQGEVIASEIRVLARRSGKRPTPYAIAKDWARNKIRSGIVTQEASPSAIQRYARAAQRSATAAQEAMLKQDVDEAFRHKQAQMLNNALVSEAKKAFDDVEGAVKRLEKVAKRKTMKSVDQDYLEQAQALLEAVDIRRRSQVSIDKQGKFEAWAREREAEGFDVVVPASFGEMLGTTNWTRLTVENLLGLDDAVKQIMHLGRLKQTLLDNKEQRDFDELVKEATDGMGNLRQKPPSDMMEPTFWDGIKSKILAADAALLKMETVFDWLDNKDSDGVFNRVVFRPIADAQENERLMLEEYITKLTDALKAVPRGVLKRWGDKVETGLLNRETGNPYVLNREQLISVALNVGNQSNLDKLTGGYGWNEGQVLSVLAHELTEAEWNYVQSVWDTIESLWPQIEAMEKRLNGVAPEKIEPRSVETPFGVLKGGYFPVVYDPRKNYDAEANAAKGRDLFETIYTRATTPKGFTKERTNVERPIHLSLGIINWHVSEVIHDLTHREAIMQADKFLSNRRIMKGVDDTLGPEVRRQFRPWLQRIANEWAYDRAGQAGIENILKQARLNTTIVGMGFRATTILMQLAGYSNSFERVGFKWVAKRLKDVGNPAAWDFVLSKSKEVAGRMNSLDRDIRDNIKDAMGKKRWLTAPKKFAFHGIAYMDRVVVVPTWLGAYDKALAEGRTEEDAIYAADRVVRQSQGAGAAKDLAAVQSGRGTAGEAFKLLTQFYSFMSAFYQRQRTFGRDVRNAKLNDAPALLARAWWLFIVPPVLAELLAGRGPDDDEDEALWAFEKIMLQVFGPIPIVRDVAPVALAKIKDEPTFGYKFTPVSGAMQSMINVSGDVSNIVEGEETKRATRNSIETVGYFTGLTTGQMAAAAQFLVDVSYGEQSPEDFADWWEGLSTGKIKEE